MSMFIIGDAVYPSIWSHNGHIIIPVSLLWKVRIIWGAGGPIRRYLKIIVIYRVVFSYYSVMGIKGYL